MDEESSWTIDVKCLSHDQLGQFLDLLRGSEHEKIQLAIRCEMIERLKQRGWTIERIVNYLVQGIVKGTKRKNIAKIWAEVLGIGEREFLEIANGK